MFALLLALALVLSLAACGSSSSSSSGTADADASTSSDADASSDAEADADADTSGEADSSTAEVEEIEVNIGVYGSTIFTAAFDVGSQWSNLGVGFGTQYLIYDALFYLDSTGNYTSRIVESYEWTDDTTMVIQLKDDIYFSNGEQLTGADVFYSLGLMQNSGRRASYYQPFLLDESSYSDDGLTITLKTEEAYAAYFGGLDFGIMCASYCEGNEENIDWFDPTQVVGSGPYTCTSFTSGVSATYEKRDDYWGLAYGYDDIYSVINCTQYSDQSTMSIDLETGGIDVAIDMALTDYDRLSQDTSSGIVTKIIESNVPYLLAMDLNNDENLADPAVREAICLAIDVEALTSAVAGSFGTVATSVLGKNELGFLDGLWYDYDPDTAKQLLEDAGYSDGDITLDFKIIGSEPYTSIAEIVQAYLAEIGINCVISSEEMATFVTSIGTPGYTDLQIYSMTGGNPYGEPVLQLENWYSDSTAPAMQRDYDDLLDAAASTLDEAERIAYYQEFQQLAYDNFDCLPLYEFNSAYAYNSEVFEDLTISSVMCVWILDATPAT